MSTFEGGCLCGAVRIKSSGEIKAKVRTHLYTALYAARAQRNLFPAGSLPLP